MNLTIKKVYDTIKNEKMILPCDKVLVGFSGGADSLFLMLSLIELKKEFDFKIYAAHLNHCIRDVEADKDEAFVKNFCNKNNIQLFTKKINIPEISKVQKISEESAGRNERYNFFNEICTKFGINKIAVAHNMNDSVETVLLNLIRGSSLKGLCGIKCINGNIIRPIINVSRSEIEEYLNNNGESFCIDSTNNIDIYTRNKIRNNILESMSQINPSVIQTIFSNLKHMNNDEDFLCEYSRDLNCITTCGSEIIINKDIFEMQHPAIKSRLIMNAFEQLKGNCNNVTNKHIEIICNATKMGNIYNMPDDVTVKISSNAIVFTQEAEETILFCKNLIPEEKCILPYNMIICCRYVSEYDLNKPNTVYIDAGQLNCDNLIVRNKKDGDKFIPYGMKGEKKLKQYFNNIKIPSYDRGKIPIVTCGDEIVAVMPYRISDKYKITSKTNKILEIQLTKEEDGYVK